jgi:2-keto-4-pentenoate hydratase
MKDHAALIQALYDARRGGAEPVGVEHLEISQPEALRAQLDVLRRLQSDGEALGGWKVGLTSGRMRDVMGKDFRPFGYVLKSRLFPSGAACPLAPIFRCRMEPELCLVLGKPLRGRVSVAEARDAVRGVAAAFEINELRVPPTWTRPLLVADGLSQWGVVVGPEAPVRDSLVDTTVRFYQDDDLLNEVTPGETMDDPYLSLARLAAQLDEYGLGLEAGQPVITGSFCSTAVERPARYRATFSDVGEVVVSFT